MNPFWKRVIWNQFGAAIDTLDQTLRACPEALWAVQLWYSPTDSPAYSQFWYRAYHTLFWLDLYLTGTEEGFVPPPPFTLIEQDENGPLPERMYTRAELLEYLVGCRQRCRATIEALTDETAQRLCRFPWGTLSFAELLLYNLRHVQEHAGQLSLILGQNGTSVPDWNPTASSVDEDLTNFRACASPT